MITAINTAEDDRRDQQRLKDVIASVEFKKMSNTEHYSKENESNFTECSSSEGSWMQFRIAANIPDYSITSGC